MKKQSPMLFQEPLIIATLQDIKDHTMRCRGLDKINEQPDDWNFTNMTASDEPNLQFYVKHKYYGGDDTDLFLKFPYGKVGDLIYARETFAWHKPLADNTKAIFKANRSPAEQARIDWLRKNDLLTAWKPSIHLPKKHSRIWLEITDIQLRRVQEVTAEIALREGIGREKEPETGRMIYKDYSKNHKNKPFQHWNDPLASWITLWDSINGNPKPGKPDLSYKANPWAWFISYKITRKP